MSDIQIIVYILLIVIYIISRAMKAKKKFIPPETGKPGFPQDIDETEAAEIPRPYNPPVSQPVTFEDLLKEFTGYKEPEVTSKPQPEADREIKKAVVENPYLKYNRPDVRENSRQDYRSLEQISYEEPVSYEDIYKGPEKMVEADSEPIDENKSRFVTYATLKEFDLHTSSRFRNLLRNPMTVKDAIVLKEILDRKYF